ncbi:MAG: MnhB domain-containing protein [Firmicutes bacterium]|nr:MnhB domain-containing protein [Bacillota bacterium]
MNSNNSEVVSKITGSLYPFIIMYGFYIIINGHITPGGGFQGGTVLAAVFISRYLAFPVFDIRISTLQTLEKIFFICILSIPVLFIFHEWSFKNDLFNSIYLVLMNTLIGFKVCCGISIIFFRFMFYEGK